MLSTSKPRTAAACAACSQQKITSRTKTLIQNLTTARICRTRRTSRTKSWQWPGQGRMAALLQAKRYALRQPVQWKRQTLQTLLRFSADFRGRHAARATRGETGRCAGGATASGAGAVGASAACGSADALGMWACSGRASAGGLALGQSSTVRSHPLPRTSCCIAWPALLLQAQGACPDDGSCNCLTPPPTLHNESLCMDHTNIRQGHGRETFHASCSLTDNSLRVATTLSDWCIAVCRLGCDLG